LAEGGSTLIPVFREFAADLETPVSVYLKVMSIPGASFLLESVEGGEQLGRYSFVGVNPRGSISVSGKLATVDLPSRKAEIELRDVDDLFEVIRSETERFKPADVAGLPRFIGGAVGYLGYDLVRFFEKLPDGNEDELEIPDSILLLADNLIVFDHARHRLLILANARVGSDVELAYVEAVQQIEQVTQMLLRPLPAIPQYRSGAGPARSDDSEMNSNISTERFNEMVDAAREHIAAGEIFQVVLSQRFSRKSNAHPFAIYRALRMLNPSPYMFYFDFDEPDFQLVGASPEMHVRYEDGIASLRPIAGTRQRGRNAEDDLALEEQLLADPKERAEHVMLVDLGRNDLGRVCEYGSVTVGEMMVVERYSHVMHIVSHLDGKLLPGLDGLDLLRATFPAGTVTGAPKVRAMEIIDDFEPTRRGPYGGAVGYIGYDGSMDTCIAIRSLLTKGEEVYVQAGAGIVADSDADRENVECRNKAMALAVAVERAESGLL